MNVEQARELAYFSGPIITALGVVVSMLAIVLSTRPYMQAYLTTRENSSIAFLHVENVGKRPAKKVTFEFSDGLGPDGPDDEIPRYVRRQLDRKFPMWPTGYAIDNVFSISSKGAEHNDGKNGPSGDVTLTIKYQGAFWFNRRKERFYLSMEVIKAQTFLQNHSAD
ncbi:hypothetical protein ACIGDM_01015 [Rothia koreensis]|uniref:hypothetical protein n=1 Tax=Rothia koreensis TaxID=592378 RepID=UPI0037CB4F11